MHRKHIIFLKYTSKFFCFQVLEDDDTAGKTMSGILLKGVWLQNASWDKNKKNLNVSEVTQETETKPMPLIHLNPVDRNQYEREKKNKTYFKCPMYISGEDDQLGADFIVSHLDLPTKCELCLLREKNVHMTCKL